MTDPAPQPHADGSTPMRLARYLAACGIASRRRCEELIRAGDVAVNGAPVESPATTVTPESDAVTFKGATVAPQRGVYLALHKPRGITCSNQDPHAEHLVSDLLPARYGRLFTIGRLDRDSEGLVLVTNDGMFAQRIQHPKHGIRKRYRVQVAGKPAENALRSMTDGFRHGGDFLKAESARWAPKRQGKTLLLVLAEGKNREIRRLCTACGMTVRRLRRESVGPVELGRIKPGQWRPLTDRERTALFEQSRRASETS